MGRKIPAALFVRSIIGVISVISVASEGSPVANATAPKIAEASMPPPVLVVNACNGSSTKLAPAQCLGWIDFYDLTGGSGWNSRIKGRFSSEMRTDPCACKGFDGKSPVCSPDGTVVQKM